MEAPSLAGPSQSSDEPGPPPVTHDLNLPNTLELVTELLTGKLFIVDDENFQNRVFEDVSQDGVSQDAFRGGVAHALMG